MRAQVAKMMTYPEILNEAWAQHLAPRAANAPTVISTFAGGGGSSLGYSMAGFHELLAVEWDDNAVATLALNFPGMPVYHGDIAKLSVADALARTGLQSGELDVFDGSPPCQGFSTAGKRDIGDSRNQLFREYVRLLSGLQPKVFVMENVSGMVKGKMKLVFAEILRELKGAGYLVSARLMNAMYFNVPQARQRMIFIGVREDLGIEPSHPRGLGMPRTAGSAIRGLVAEPEEHAMLTAAGLKYAAYKHWNRIRIGGSVDEVTGGAGFSGQKIDPNSPMRTVPKNDGHITMHGSMHGSMHWSERRRFTLAEYKRFGSFPDQFQFTDWSNGVMRIGNSVPPLLTRAIALHIRGEILDRL